jgi:hypothetical protein
MKTWGSGGIAPLFLTLAVYGGEWSASRPCRFNLGERSSSIHWIGSWLGSRAGRRYGEEKNINPAGNQTPAVQTLVRRYTDWAIPTFMFLK